MSWVLQIKQYCLLKNNNNLVTLKILKPQFFLLLQQRWLWWMRKLKFNDPANYPVFV